MSQKKIQELALKWMKGEATPEEEQELFGWYNEDQDGISYVDARGLQDEKELRERMLRNMDFRTGAGFVPVNDRRSRRFMRPLAAAAVSCLLIAGIWLWGRHTEQNPVKAIARTDTGRDLSPGSDKAVLTLSDGSKLVLEETGNGVIGHQANAEIVKTGSQVAYVGKEGHAAGDPGADGVSRAGPVYNTVSTSRKGQYHLVLADGTGVWLDAASYIRFPTSFTGSDRTVAIGGQVYFEVANNPQKPFRVSVPANDLLVQVLGTHFNIMAYADEPVVSATLLEGAIRVKTVTESLLLRPGQQAQVEQQAQGTLHLLNGVNVDRVMAWKNGLFELGGTSIEEIMRQVARWYDAEIVYQGDISRLKFSGEISRKKNAAELFQILEATGTVQFKIEGKRITVIPNK